MGSSWQNIILKTIQENRQEQTPRQKGNTLVETLREQGQRPRDEYGRFVSEDKPE